jgi:hypothetical protein
MFADCLSFDWLAVLEYHFPRILYQLPSFFGVDSFMFPSKSVGSSA